MTKRPLTSKEREMRFQTTMRKKVQKYGYHENRNKKRISLTDEQQGGLWMDSRNISNFIPQTKRFFNLTEVVINQRKSLKNMPHR